MWIAFSCGLWLDLFSSETRLGFFAFTYTLTTLLLYRLRWNFFADHLSTLPIMSGLFSCTSTLIEVITLSLAEKELLLSWPWVFTDLLILPALDGIYGFAIFILPEILFKTLKLLNNALINKNN